VLREQISPLSRARSFRRDLRSALLPARAPRPRAFWVFEEEEEEEDKEEEEEKGNIKQTLFPVKIQHNSHLSKPTPSPG